MTTPSFAHGEGSRGRASALRWRVPASRTSPTSSSGVPNAGCPTSRVPAAAPSA